MNKIATSLTISALALVWSATSSGAPADDMPVLAAPSNLNAIATSAHEVSLSWYDNSTDERGFYIRRSLDGISWDNVGNLSADAGEFRDAGLDPDTLYMYRVFAYNSSGESQASNRDTAATPAYYNLELSFSVSALVPFDH